MMIIIIQKSGYFAISGLALGVSNYCFIQCLNDHNNKTVIKERMNRVLLANIRRVFYCLHIFINDILLSNSDSLNIANYHSVR